MDSKIRLVPEYAKCRDELKPGQLKRVPARGQCVGVFLRCPACGALLAFTADAVSLTESSEPTPRPLSLSGCTCRSCNSQIFTTDEWLCATTNLR